jgi:hypothetical protein
MNILIPSLWEDGGLLVDFYAMSPGFRLGGEQFLYGLFVCRVLVFERQPHRSDFVTVFINTSRRQESLGSVKPTVKEGRLLV